MGNQNSGRRPKPTAIHILNGNPSRKKLSDREPEPPPEGPIEKPAGLSAAAGKVWDTLAPICRAMRTLTVADLSPFATLCELQASRDMASAQKSAPGFTPFVVSQDYNGADVVKIHAALKLEGDMANKLRPYYEYFGLTPVSRARIAVPKATSEAPVSKWAGILK